MNELNKKAEQLNSTVNWARPATRGEHAMEFVAELMEVSYVNDSKSVNIKSTCESIAVIDAPLVLIIGGVDKDTDFSYLLNADMNKVKMFIYLGKDQERMMRFFGRYNLLFAPAASLEEAVNMAHKGARPGQVVLFSPACPSFEIFDNYKNRGNRFRELVKNLSK